MHNHGSELGASELEPIYQTTTSLENDQDKYVGDSRVLGRKPKNPTTRSDFGLPDEGLWNEGAHGVDQTDDNSRNEADKNGEERSEQDEIEVRSKEKERQRHIEDTNMSLGRIGFRSQRLDAICEERDELVLDSQASNHFREEAALRGTAGAKGEILEDEPEGEGGEKNGEARFGRTRDGESEGNEGRGNAGILGGSQGDIMDSGRIGMSANNTAGPDIAHTYSQRAGATMSNGSASHAESPTSNHVVNSGHQVGRPASPTQRQLLGDFGGSHNREQVAATEETQHSNMSAPAQGRSTITLGNYPGSQRPSILLQTLQERHATKLRQLLEDLSRPRISRGTEHQRRLQLDWLSPQRWASIYAEPEHCLGRSSAASPEDADVWYLSWDSFRRYADSGYVFRRPVVIKQNFQDSGMYDIDEYVDMLWQRFPEEQIKVQNSLSGECALMSMKEYSPNCCFGRSELVR